MDFVPHEFVGPSKQVAAAGVDREKLMVNHFSFVDVKHSGIADVSSDGRTRLVWGCGWSREAFAIGRHEVHTDQSGG